MPISFLRRLVPLFLFTFIVISPTVLATARLLMMDRRGALAATRPELNLALPESPPEIISSDSDHIVVDKQKLPCAMSSSDREVELLNRFEAGNYGSLFLSALPKGKQVPPSGPSRRTNDMNN